jgi:hypothetical protein
MHSEIREGPSIQRIRFSPPRTGGDGKLCSILLALVFAVSRVIYFALGVRPDTIPIGTY